ncbi:uncharacterized protein LOC112347420 [Selaginella moellendorffii]|uniref:uncharacterized protein LOC112347420 n=1 Tax=Selaginella moellendorffii TaxID=88036 RepID=UPI000D1C3B6B|nr:uncharacterized protein LOC112347420 [Selaginella moellendorffii]|eukprot:XP_024533967.1 uncharacterized protein LOC112347420 [Selaginella moellendorffii]
MAMASIARLSAAPPAARPIGAKTPRCFFSSQCRIDRSRRNRGTIARAFSDDSRRDGEKNAGKKGGQEEGEEEGEEGVEDLMLPVEWSTASAAAEESQWLRENLHAWLDNEYCPEPANAEISDRCATVYYRCLIEKELDAGNILMRIVENLESFSFKESFHGAFSSANAAIQLILTRVK